MRILTLSTLTLASLLLLPCVQAADNTKALHSSYPSNVATDFSSQENEELIIAVLYRKQESLSDGMIAYAIDGDIALPLEQLMLLVEFPIKFDSEKKAASGWFIRENRHFSLDLASGNVLSDGKRFTVSPSQLRVVDGELFVPSTLLSQWFPLTINSNLRALEVTIIPRDNTAIDERIEREKRKFGSVYQVFAKNPEYHTPYKAFTVPSVSANIGLGYNESKAIGQYGNISLRAHGDIAYMAGKATLLANEDGLTDARLSLSRRNPRGGLLGSLNATELTLGDISSRSLPLISGSSSGRGIRVTRRPAGYVGNLETITLEGILETGYSVELYRNNILINATQSGKGTQYQFLDLALLTGQNEFRLEFYGPQGQRDTKITRYNNTTSQLKKGEVNYDISLSQPNKTLFDVGLNSRETEDSLAFTASINYGLTRNLTFSSGLASRPRTNDDEDDNFHYGFIGLGSQFSGVSGNLDITVDENGSTAWVMKAATKINKHDLSVSYTQYNNDFISNRTLSDDSGRQIQSTFNLSADTASIKLGKRHVFNIGINANQNNFTDDDWSRQYTLNMSNQIRHLRIANNLSYTHHSNDIEPSFTGQTQLNTRLGKLQLRLSSDFILKPQTEIQQLQVGLSYPFKNNYNASLNFTEDYTNDSQLINTSLSKQFKAATLSLSATQQLDADGEDNKAIFLTASFGSFTDQKTRKTDFSHRAGFTGASRVTAYLDENRDGLLNTGELAIPDIKIKGYNTTSGKTDVDGQALVKTSFFNDWTDLYLVDSNVYSVGKGRSVLNRPGVTSEVHLPVYLTGNVEGHITLSEGQSKQTRQLSNLEIQALQRHPSTGKQEVVATTFSAYDGFYSLVNIPLGDVQLRINPKQLTRLAVDNNPIIKLVLEKDNLFLEGHDFTLTR